MPKLRDKQFCRWTFRRNLFVLGLKQHVQLGAVQAQGFSGNGGLSGNNYNSVINSCHCPVMEPWVARLIYQAL